MSDQQQPEQPAQPVVPPAAPPGVPPPPPTAPPVAPGPPMGPPPGSSGLFKSGKQKTIALIAGGVLAAGVLGGLVAVVAGGGDDESSTAGGTGQNAGILNPKPVGNVETPAPPAGEATPTPTPTPETAPTEAPVPTPVQGSSDGLVVGTVTIALPSGWSLVGDVGSDNALVTDGAGTYVSILTGVVDPTTDAASLLGDNVGFFVGGDNYSDVSVDPIQPIDPFGSVVSGAVTTYGAVWVDAQGVYPVRGAIWSAVRQDGTALLMSAETAKKEWDASSGAWGPVVDETYSLFGSS